MQKSNSFIRDLFTEIRMWTAKGIITPEQRSRIEALYLPEETAPAASEPSVRTDKGLNITGVIIALASLCLAVGIIIFYAANWKKMPPSLKLIQVFFLVIGSYAGAAYFLFSETRSRLIGQSLLFIGMCSFGAAIMLVAQIYHISAHPTNGVLAWAIGVFAMAILMKDKPGFYLSALLFFIWYIWESSVFKNPGYLYLLYITVSTAIYIQQKSKIGITASLCFLILFFYNTVAPDYFRYSFDSASAINFAMLNIPVAVLLYSAGLFLRKFDIVKPAAALMNVFGMLLFITVFCSISWLGNGGEAGLPQALHNKNYLFIIHYTAFTLAACEMIFLLFKEKKDFLFSAALLAFPVIAAFLPMGISQVRMISTHSVIVFLVFALLYLSYQGRENIIINKAFAFTFVFSMVVIKGIGFFGYSLYSEPYKVAYLSGFIIFALVCLLINALVAHITRKNGKEYPSGILHALCAVMIWLALYAASFETGSQNSILTANNTVIILLILFSVIALSLIIILSKVLKEKKLIICNAAVIFTITLITLFSANPKISWIFYSIMFNAMLIIVTAVYIHYSAITRSKAVLNLAVIAFAAIIFTRYFDLFWDMLSGSILFISTGIIGLAGGYFLERKRRKLSRQIDTGGASAVKSGGRK